MRILTPERILFTGRHRCPEFDCPEGPLLDNLQVLLCLLDGAERRKHLQARLNRLGPRTSARRIDEASA
jgi:hypothetical protein